MAAAASSGRLPASRLLLFGWGPRDGLLSGAAEHLRWMAEVGIPLRLGSDAPVAPLDPWLAMAAAVHRSADEREPWAPEQALTPQEALAASTDGITSIEVGGPGDLVLLDDDPMREDLHGTAEQAAHLRGMRPLATVVRGRLVHSR